MNQPNDHIERMNLLHGWYHKYVMPVKLVPEIQRLWLGFFKADHNGIELEKVVRYLQKQIALGKRNAGSLKLTNLLATDELGSLLKFEEELALASVTIERGRTLPPSPESPRQEALHSIGRSEPMQENEAQSAAKVMLTPEVKNYLDQMRKVVE